MKNIAFIAFVALVMLQSCEDKDRLNQIKRQLMDGNAATEFNGEMKKGGKYTFKEVVRGTAPGKFDKDAKPGWVGISAPKINKPTPPESEYQFGDYYNGYYNDYYPDSYDYDYYEPEYYEGDDY